MTKMPLGKTIKIYIELLKVMTIGVLIPHGL